MLQTGLSGVQMAVGAMDFYLLQNIQTALQPTQIPIQWVLQFFPGGQVARAWLTIQFHLVPRLRMSGRILLLSIYAFMMWTKKPLPLPT
jgi:hypothetical protein